MRRSLATLLITVLPTLLLAQVNRAVQSSSLVFNHVTVIDMRSARPKADMTVVIQGNRLIKIGKSAKTRIPKNSVVIDATGKFLIPGLWDMHVHLGDEDFDKDSNLKLFVANGVTGVRFMDGDPAYHHWRKEIESGTLLGPRIVVASQMIGFGDLSNISAEAARDEVRKAKKEGADFIKVHDNVLRESYFALIDEARSLNLPVAGHVPASMTAAEASNAGQKSIEHSTRMEDAKSDSVKADALIAVLRRNGTWLCPTLIMRSNYAYLDSGAWADDRRLKYAKPSWIKRWLTMTRDSGNLSAAEWARRKESVRKEKALVAKMQKAGVGFLAGTDVTNPYVLPGFGLHDELSMMVDAGLTPLQALQTATINPAKFFNQLDSLGTIQKGKLADLVLLDANPIEDIRNTQRINAVVANGRYCSKEALQQTLAEVEAAAKRE